MSCCGVFIMPTEVPVQRPPRPDQPMQITGRMVAAMLIAFFAVVAAVNAVMMTVAIRTMPGVDVRSPYDVSQRFNAELEKIRVQDAQGWKVDGLAQRDGQGARLTVQLRDRFGAPVSGLRLAVLFEHPTTHAQDHHATLAEDTPGRYVAKIESIHAGMWLLTLTANRDREVAFVSQNRIVLKD